jgi:DNA repair exonuclease SbcCD ATPase subunit
MATDRELKISVKAVNDAQKTLTEVKNDLARVIDQMGKTSKSSESLATSVFKGVASWDILKKSINSTIGFLKSSFTEGVTAEKQMAQVATNVRNAGLEYEKLAPAIKEASDKAKELGFSGGLASESLSRFLLVTKNATQSQALLSLAMDLSRNKGIDLADATRAVLAVTQGNSKALREYGIELGDNATTADVLTEAQNKLRDSAKDFAGTTAGKLEILNEKWNDMKEQIGEALTPAVTKFMQYLTDNLPIIQAGITSLVDGVTKVVGVAVGTIDELTGASVYDAYSKGVEKNKEDTEKLRLALEKLGKENTTVSETIKEDARAYVEASSKLNNYKLAQDLFKLALDGVGPASKKATENLVEMGLVNKDTKVTTEMATETLGKFYNQINGNQYIVETTKDSFDSLTKSIKLVAETSSKKSDFTGLKNNAPTKEVENLTESIRELGKQFTDLGYSAEDALAKISESHKEKLNAFKTQLADIRSQIAQATEDFNKQSGTDKSDVAGSIVANEERIAEIRKELATEVEKTKRIELETELAQRQQAELDNATFIASISDQIAEVKRRNALSDVARAIEDYNSKRALAEQEYSEKVSRLQKEAKEIKKQRDEEKKLYQEKVTLINQLNSDAEKSLANSLAKNTLNTKENILKQIEYYKSLAEAIKASQSGNASEISRISTRVQKVNDAIISPKGDIISTHPDDYLIATKNPQNLGGGKTIIINIDTMIGSREFAEEMGNEIVKTLQLQEQI